MPGIVSIRGEEGMAEVTTVVKDVAIDAFFIVAGYFVAKVVVGFLGKMVPQLAGLGNWAILGLGVLGIVYGSGMTRQLATGASVLAMVNIIETFASPFLVQLESAVVR
jgi:hypothetical protein